jgi:hypothetical protein
LLSFKQKKLDPKRSEKCQFLFCLEGKRVSRKRNEKLVKHNKAKKWHFFHICLVQKSDAMKSEKKRLFSTSTRETYVKRISFRLVSLRSENKFEAKPAHPSPISHFPPALQYIVYYSLG